METSKSCLYEMFLRERNEILKHKWIESEKHGYDIGFERALLDWVINYRKGWRDESYFQEFFSEQ